MFIAGLTIPADAVAADRRECQKIKEQIRAIEARMRRPYTASQGVRLDERLRKLKDKRYRVCR